MAYGAGLVSVWDTFPKATHGAIPFPVEQSSIKGGLRHHIHEYPHSPGGAGEKLGRKLYVFDVLANFDTNFDNYPGLYPQDLDTLLGNWEQQVTQDLRLPQMAAAVPAYAFEWTREASARVRSGEKVRVQFLEDQTSLFLFGDIVALGTGQIELGATALTQNIAAIRSQLVPSAATTAMFASLQSAIGSVLSLQDSAILFDQRLGAALQQVQNLCGAIDAQPDMQPVAAYSVIETLHEIWQAAQQLQGDLLSQGRTLETWTNPITQDVGSIAVQIYGDTSQLSALLALNPFPNNARVPAGTPVLYYPSR